MTAALLDPGMSGSDVCRLVRELRDGADAVTSAFGDCALFDVSEAALPDLVLDLSAAIDRLIAAQALAVGRVHATGVLRAQGVASTKMWLARQVRTTGGDAAAAMGRARDLADAALMPSRNALLAGAITSAQHRAITVGLRRCERSIRTGSEAVIEPDVARSVLFGEGQALLLEAAADHGPEDLERLAVRLRHLVDPDGAGQDQIDAHTAQRLTIRLVGELTDVRGTLDVEGGAALTTVLDRIVDAWYRDGTLTKEETVESARDVAARRSRRDHDRALALRHLALSMLDEGRVGTSHGVRPHLTLTADLADLVAAQGSGELHVPGVGPIDIPIATVARFACIADVSVHVVDHTTKRDSEVTWPSTIADDPGRQRLARLQDRLEGDARTTLWLGRAHRHVTSQLWQYLVARDRHCRAPGCGTDPTRCQPHHVLPWWAGGPTDPENLVLLCHSHHQLIHEGRWIIGAKPGAPPGDPDRWTFTTRR